MGPILAGLFIGATSAPLSAVAASEVVMSNLDFVINTGEAPNVHSYKLGSMKAGCNVNTTKITGASAKATLSSCKTDKAYDDWYFIGLKGPTKSRSIINFTMYPNATGCNINATPYAGTVYGKGCKKNVAAKTT